MANVCLPQKGLWKVKVKGFNLPTGNAQPYSLVSSHSFLPFCPVWPPDICDLIPALCPPYDICDRFPWICEAIKVPDVIIRDDIWIVDPSVPQPIDEICKYVIDCPGCGGSSWEYCPGWDMRVGGLPEDVKVSIINEYGSIVFEDTSNRTSRQLKIEKGLPGQRYYILFTDNEGNPYKESMRLTINSKAE